MRYLRAVLLCALLIVGIAAGAAAVGAQPEPAEEVRLVIDLEDDGDARWHVVTRIPLEDDDAVESFESFGNDFEAGAVDFDRSVDVFETAAAETSANTQREMEIVNVSREWAVVNATEQNETETERVGELRLSFTWTNFAREVDGTVVVDDAFNTTDGTWLPGLAEGQTLVIRPPEGYGSPSTAPVPPQEEQLRWEGPTTFPPGYFEDPGIVYQPGVEPTPPATPAPDGPDLTTMLLAGALILSLVALLLGLYLLFRRRDGEAEPSPAEGSDGDREPEPGPHETQPETDGHEEEDDELDLELLSDEERVERLLERNDGRMKQAAIVEETGWSNAKVSQLLSSMDEEGRVNKLRIGRENLITLPDEDLSELDEE